MLPEPTAPREQSQPPSAGTPIPRRPGRPADVAKKKKTVKNVPRKDNEVTKAETGALIDDL